MSRHKPSKGAWEYPPRRARVARPLMFLQIAIIGFIAFTMPTVIYLAVVKLSASTCGAC